LRDARSRLWRRWERVARSAGEGFSALILVLATKAHAEPLTLRLADGLPSGHVFDRMVIEPFIEGVAEASHGEIVLRHFPAEQLGKSRDMLILTQKGIADIGYVVPSYMSDKMPLTAVTELPGIFQGTCQGNAALRALTREGGILERREFTPNGMRPLIIFLMPAYQLILSTAKPLHGIGDVEGLKIRTPGGAMDLTVRGIKAVPIRMQPADLYQSMSRGTVEGALLAYQSAVSYSLSGMLKSGTIGQDFGTVAVTFSISLEKWNALPETARTVLDEVGRKIAEEACGKLDKAEQAAIDKVRAQGATLAALDPSDHAALEADFARVRATWAEELDRRGRPGSEVLAAFTAAVAAAQ
jgi:TRAP-type C4-dicarboxylate transport system substrate-binding protein